MKFLTKGDNNSVDDRGLYAPGQLWLTKRDVVGRARGFLPYVGMVTILMNEYPKFKVIIFRLKMMRKLVIHAFKSFCDVIARPSKLFLQKEGVNRNFLIFKQFKFLS